MKKLTIQSRKAVGLAIALLFLLTVIWTGSALAHSKKKLTRTNKEGPVTVSAIYMNPLEKKGFEELRFQVKLDTHSVDLEQYDLEQLSFLRFDKGKLQKSLKLNREGSGHHITNVVLFQGPVPEGTTSLVLVIKNVGNVAERKLEWELPLHN